jgi:outer membrane murein-binding lipoprotein Lpp
MSVSRDFIDFSCSPNAEHKLDMAAAEIVALKGVVTRLQKTVEQLEAAQKAAGDKKPGTK